MSQPERPSAFEMGLKCGACNAGKHFDCSGWCFCPDGPCDSTAPAAPFPTGVLPPSVEDFQSESSTPTATEVAIVGIEVVDAFKPTNYIDYIDDLEADVARLRTRLSKMEGFLRVVVDDSELGLDEEWVSMVKAALDG